MRLILLAVGLAVGTASARAQTVLVVQVADAGGAFVAEAQVRLPSLGRVARTKWDGEARFDGLEPGRHRVEVRAIGFAPSDRDVEVSGDTVPVTFKLQRVAPTLDTVRVKQTRSARLLREFEDRRAIGIGRFFTDSTLMDHRTLGLRMFLSTRVPGLKVKGNGVVYGEGCKVLFYLDGFEVSPMPSGRVGRGGIGGGNGILDLDEYPMHTLAGVETYTRATAPVPYNRTGNYCALILMWTKW
ncbi:MAG: carboxypeptidase-like regulatory domain-containing protein [bacterium]